MIPRRHGLKRERISIEPFADGNLQTKELAETNVKICVLSIDYHCFVLKDLKFPNNHYGVCIFTIL